MICPEHECGTTFGNPANLIFHLVVDHFWPFAMAKRTVEASWRTERASACPIQSAMPAGSALAPGSAKKS